MEKEIPLSLPDLGLAQPLPPRPHFPLPLFFSASAQRQLGPFRGPEGHPAPRASPSLPQPLTAGSHAPAPLPGGTVLSGSSSTLSPSRLRVEFNNRARVSRGAVRIPPDCRPLYTARSPTSPPSHPEPQPPRRVRPSSPSRSAASSIRRCSASRAARAACRTSVSVCEVACVLLLFFRALCASLSFAELSCRAAVRPPPSQAHPSSSLTTYLP